MKSLLTIALLAGLTIGTTACERRHKVANKSIKGGAGVKKALPPQTKDECPSAEGHWVFADNSKTEIIRREGILTIKAPTTEDIVVLDGKPRPLKDTETGEVYQVTGSCKKQVITIKFEKKAPTLVWRQEWRVDLEKDMIGVLDIQEGQKPNFSEAYRDYSIKAEPKKEVAPPTGIKN